MGMLQDLWRQQAGRCARTKELLKPGINASLDHIVPISRYKEIFGNMKGVHDITNLQWVTKRYNIAKNNMLEEEFQEFIKTVYTTNLKRKGYKYE